MPVRSLLGFLGLNRRRSEDTLRLIINRLLESIELYAIRGDDFDYNTFCSEVRALKKRFMADSSKEELLLLTGQITATLKQYEEITSRFRSNQGLEYRRMVTMLTQSIAFITQHCAGSAERLKDIETQLERATVMEDILTLRLRLEDCLQSIQNEIHRNEVAGRDAAVQFSGNSEPAYRPVSEYDTDPVTGLPGRKAAEAALLDAAACGRSHYAVAVVAGRIENINSAHGYEFGDRALFQVFEQIRDVFNKKDQIFRWRGPTFLALMERPVGEVMHEITKLSKLKLEHSVDIGTHSLFFPIPLTWELFAVIAPLHSLTLRIDRFVAAQVPSRI